MTDLASYTPGPECLAARERLLEGIMATWPKPKPKAERQKDIPISMTLLRAAAMDVIKATSLAWRREYDLKREMTLYAAETKTPLPNNYWVPEQIAHARYNVAALVAEAFAP